MKKFSKKTALNLTIITSVLLVIAFIISFVPMTFGSKTFVSLVKTINVSNDLAGGMYGEYDIVTENPTSAELTNSMAKIKKVFEEDGYKNVNVYTVGNSKLRVEVSYPTGSKTYLDVYEDLSVVPVGKFVLNSSSSISADDTKVVYGNECVDDVVIFTNNSTKYISIEFNKTGEKKFEELCNSTSTVYIHLGEYNQSITVSGITDYSTFTLSDNDYKNLIQLKKNVIFGCMDIELNSSTAVINTMSSNISSNSSASSPEEFGFLSSPASVVIFSALAIVIVLGLALFALRFGLFAVVIAVSLLINSYLLVAGLCLVPSVEIGISSVIALVAGLAFTYTCTYIFADKVKSEYNSGKSFTASLESASKKTVASNLISGVLLFLLSLIMFAFSFGEITSASVVFAICAFLALITNFVVVPFLVKVGISYGKNSQKLFMLKKRSISFEMNAEKEDGNKEEE